MSGATLRTARLTLSPPGWRDAPFLLRIAGNGQARRFLGGPVPLRRRLGAVGRQIASSGHVWVAKAGRRRLGWMSLSPHHDDPAPELSFVFHPAAWGQGFACEACRAILDHARAVLHLPRLVAETQAANTRSRQLLARLGFRPERALTRFGAAQILYAVP